MEVIRFSDDQKAFWLGWNEYITTQVSSFRYLETYIRFMKSYSDKIIHDASFIIIENDKVAAIAFLPIEEINGVKTISLSGSFTVGPLAKFEKAERFVFGEIRQIASSHNVSAIKFYAEPLIDIYTGQYNRLRSYGYLDCSSTDQLLDLHQDEVTLWANLRKSYRSLINGIINKSEYELIFVDQDNLDYPVNEEYRKMHAKAAGRETRPKSTFDLQYELVKEGKGMITGLKLNGQFIAFNYFLIHQKTVVYMSAADDPDYASQKIPFYHGTLWASIIRLKKMGLHYIQMSSPASTFETEGFMDYSDKKQLNIAYFKKGMGAVQVPFNKGIMYFDKEMMLKDIEVFKENILLKHLKYT